MKSRAILSLFLLVTASLSSLAQEKKPIEFQSQANRIVYENHDGTVRNGGGGFRFEWRYEGEESWRPVNKIRDMQPLLSQYSSSNRLYKQAYNTYTYGMPTGYVVAIGGVVMFTAGIMQKSTYDPMTGVESAPASRKTLMIGGAATALVGCGIVGYSMYGGKKKLESAVAAYNREVKKETSYNPWRLDLQLVSMSGSTLGLRMGLSF